MGDGLDILFCTCGTNSDRPCRHCNDYPSDDLLDQGCTCPMGHPPCSFCTDALVDEEEREIYLNEGARGVREHRRGDRAIRIKCEEVERQEAVAQTERMISNPKYGSF